MTLADRLGSRDVLVATDFSACSEQALRVGVAYAQALGGRLFVLHVGGEGDLVARTEEWVRAVLPGVVVNVVVEPGSPAAAIVRHAAEYDMGLVVVGTHGRTGVSRALLGSVAEKVARTASCPVLTVPPRAAVEAPVGPHEALPSSCLVCARPTEDLICASCRARIRGEALERKHRLERAGRTGVASS